MKFAFPPFLSGRERDEALPNRAAAEPRRGAAVLPGEVLRALS
jgi:hypothetical protein